MSDGLEIEAVFQSLGPSFGALVLSLPSSWYHFKQDVVPVPEVLNDLLGVPVTPVAVDILWGRQCVPRDALG
jgi:hypothetical protein